ncbi:leader peptidase (prepilin peptidase)/N-methyltransferase [Rhodococcus sp. OK519]|uniref:prepilin peptidase n=1 Tax=Rhodococcus sp. OK519 TaxID=2135729 RepID=UPI000D3CE7F3|nr:leader peptidase (prepilin peptidase)/N-methyltransferase [Rhodococcus sp. OK519]
MIFATSGVAAILGILAGTFANRAIDRVRFETAQGADEPSEEVRGYSPAPATSARIAVLDTLIRPRDTSARHVLVELSTALLFVAVTLRLAALDLLPAAPAYLYFAALGVALTVIDIDCKRLPNFLVVPAYPILFVCLTAASVILNDWPALLRAAIGAIVLFGFYLVLALIYPAGMGFGDVKLAGVIGAVLAFISYGTLLVGAFLAFLLAAVVGVILLAGRRSRIGTTIPFGPYMIAAAIVAILAADPLARAYLRWSGAA